MDYDCERPTSRSGEPVQAPSAGGEVPVQRRNRVAVAGSVGHFVEWFDWAAYAYLAVYLSAQFFPAEAESGVAPLIETFGVFAVGFLARPFGGLVLGAVGDRYGGRSALMLSVAMMGGGGLLIAVIPTYDDIGVAAPLLLMLARLVQGLSTGGEFAAASTFIVEAAPRGRRGLYSSFLYISSNLGNIAVTGFSVVLVAALGETTMGNYGWRLVFAVEAVLALVGWVIRRSTVPSATDNQRRRDRSTRRPGLFDFARRYPRESLQVVGVTMGPAVAFYTWTAYLPGYAATSGGLRTGQALIATTVALLAFAIAQPLAGTLSDRVGRKPVLMIAAGGFIVGTVPAFALLQGNIANLLAVQCGGLVVLACATALSGAVMVEIFPTQVRVSGIAFPYSLAAAVFGGTAPVIATALQGAGHSSWFGWYLVACMVITLGTVLSLPETARSPLRAE